MVIDRDQVSVLLSLMRIRKKKVKSQNFTKKKRGIHYPLSLGYSTQVRRPVRDILDWMETVEDLLEIILEEVDN